MASLSGLIPAPLVGFFEHYRRSFKCYHTLIQNTYYYFFKFFGVLSEIFISMWGYVQVGLCPSEVLSSGVLSSVRYELIRN